MHQYEVTEVNCPFRCFSLSMRCINTHVITLYGQYFVSVNFVSVTFGRLHTLIIKTICLFQQTWQHTVYNGEKRIKEGEDAPKYKYIKYVKMCVQLDQTVPSCAIGIVRYNFATNHTTLVKTVDDFQ